MLEYKHMTKIIVFMMVGVMAALLLLSDPLPISSRDSQGYETKLFGQDGMLDLNIVMEPSQWEELLANPLEEKYYPCDVEVAGVTFHNVGIRTKGNTSLRSLAQMEGNQRYSLKLEFDHYIEGQTCFGLDKLVLNCNYADATSMKEALVYDMFQYLGADASLYRFTNLKINGNPWGVYLALEGVEESFLTRNYGSTQGNLYKPDSLNHDNKNVNKAPAEPAPNEKNPLDKATQVQATEEIDEKSHATEQKTTSPSAQNETASSQDNGKKPTDPTSQIAEGVKKWQEGRGNFRNNNGSDLNYSDDQLSSYSAIWEGEVTKTNSSDHEKVVTALKNISKGEDLENYMGIDNLLKYMAVHTFVVNEDSLSGNMAHNYYLYEEDGKLNILPWDYNLIFGGMGAKDATSVINEDVTDPFRGTDFFDTLLAQESYRKIYYQYLRKLCENYVFQGNWELFYKNTKSQIDGKIKEDPTALYSYEQYTQASELLDKVVKLRAQAILNQLDQAEQSVSKEKVDTSSISLKTLGSMGGQKNLEKREEKVQSKTTQKEKGAERSVSTENNNKKGQSKKSAETLSSATKTPADTEQQKTDKRADGPEQEGLPQRQKGGDRPMTPQNNQSTTRIWQGISIVVMAVAVIFAYRFPKKSLHK